VSNEPSGLLEKHIEKKGIAYPIAKVKGETAKSIYGVKGFPSSFLVDPTGRIVWSGHPGNLKDGDLEEALAGASFVPQVEGDDYKKLNKLIRAQQFGAAMAAITKGLVKAGDDEGLQGAKASIEGLLKRKVEAAEAASGEGDFGPALAIYSELETLFKGHPAAKEAKTSAKALSKNPEAKDELAAWKKMVKGDQACFMGELEKAGKIYAGVAKKYEGTKCGARAQEFLKRHRM
jgi:hypothetical protein